MMGYCYLPSTPNPQEKASLTRLLLAHFPIYTTTQLDDAPGDQQSKPAFQCLVMQACHFWGVRAARDDANNLVWHPSLQTKINHRPLLGRCCPKNFGLSQNRVLAVASSQRHGQSLLNRVGGDRWPLGLDWWWLSLSRNVLRFVFAYAGIYSHISLPNANLSEEE